MTTVSYNGQCFSVDGRRVWVMAAAMQYARIPPESWADRIADAAEAGFNTIETACPWALHEPRRGRFVFQDQADLGRFLDLCAERSLRVILRVGPFVGAGFDGGGLPSWVLEEPTLVVREGNEPFLERVSRYFRRLLGDVADRQATRGGPVLLVQIEHEWLCGNDDEAARYLGEITRIVRECGITVPLVNANNLWVDATGTIDTWGCDDDMLANLRQLRTVQPGAPRLVSAFEKATQSAWGRRPANAMTADLVLRRLAEILAAGGQPIVTPFHAGTHFGFSGGALPGLAGGLVTTAAATGAVLGEAGARTARYGMLRRIVTFASHFGHVFSDLDPDYQPVALDPDEVERNGVSVVPLRGSGGRVVFVFADGPRRATTLLLDNGVRLPIDLGDQRVGWYVLDADLHGQGRLDYANLCPFAIVARSIVVLQGRAGAPAVISVNGTPLQATVPSGRDPAVLEHKGITFVVCNQEQIDATCIEESVVHVGAVRIGTTLAAAPGWTKARRIEVGGTSTVTVPRRAAVPSRTIRLGGWEAASAVEHASGASPRFASLPGPQPLSICGASTGYGWYRVAIGATATRRRLVALPKAGHRIHLYVNGSLAGICGYGPGAQVGPIGLHLSRGSSIVALADNAGRLAHGNWSDGMIGIGDHLYEVKPRRSIRPKVVTREAVDPFRVRRFITGLAVGRLSDARQLEWTFSHRKRTPLLLVVSGAARGTFVVNGAPLAYYPGESGTMQAQIPLVPDELAAMKRGTNVIRFAPDPDQPDALREMSRGVMIFECVENLTAGAEWAFAKWEPPASGAFTATTPAHMKGMRGAPCWWRCRAPATNGPGPWWLDVSGLSKGVAFVNGHAIGRYFTATRTGRAIGPQLRLAIPPAWLHDGQQSPGRQDGALRRDNEILVFDEHGFAPTRMKLVQRATGDLD
jgi:beta-galactosidase